MRIDTVVRDFTRNSENTMNKALSNSVGVLLLHLMKTYFPDASDDEMGNNYHVCFDKLRTIAKDDAERLAAIDNFTHKANEAPSMLDRVSLYSEDGVTTYALPLKNILTLVWTALNDDTKFTHHLYGTTDEKLTQAKKDKALRIDSFFSTLDTIKSEAPCHTGVRHQLVFLLNKTYKGVHLIEDAKSTVLSFLRENLLEKFWDVFEEASDKTALKSALLTWMTEANPKPLLAIVDPSNTIPFELSEFFKKHGMNPKDIKLDDLIDQALSSLEFSTDVAHPALSDVHWLLSAMSSKKDSAEYVTALSNIQTWIKSDYQLDNTADQEKIHEAFLMFHTHQRLNQNHFLLTLMGKLADCGELSADCDSYFKAIVEGYVHNVMLDRGKPDSKDKERGIYLYRASKPKQTFALVVHNETLNETVNLSEICEGSEQEALLRNLTWPEWPEEGEESASIDAKFPEELVRLITSNCKHTLVEDVSPPVLSEETIARITTLNKAIVLAKKDTMKDQIENFFVEFYIAHNDHQHYTMLLAPTFQSKIILTDEEINHFIESNRSMSSEGITEINVEVYWINRVFYTRF